ncbi:MAG TPA: pyridoxal phosphate-dependent aminotransferase [Rhizomicrobium sp.]|jgi:aspartate aminotransferase|nr:pyridoxal phosphate-dependent aminotransferase [Rhizomicrobium sp.]
MADKIPYPARIRALELSGITKVAAMGLGNPDILPLWFGESDLVTPKFIRDAAIAALEDGKTFYTHARGILKLREELAAFHQRTSGADVEVERITVPGAAMLAITSALQALIETGDNIVIVSPIWPNIFQAAKIAGAAPRLVRLDEDWASGKWRLDLQKLFDTCDTRTKAIFIASPGNPTGWMMTAEEQKQVLEFSRARGIAIISDEVYGTLVYDGAPHAPSFLPIAKPDDAVFVIGSFSKPWAMTGWRIGWLVHPLSLAIPIGVMAQADNTGAAHFLQYGALAALSPQGDVFRGELLARCAKGREVVEDFLKTQNRIRWIKPDGAFYGFLNVEGMKDSVAFAQEMVRTMKVGVAPGAAFSLDDPHDESYLRICFAQDSVKLAEGLNRIAAAVGTI